jgi:hypothetical protein
VNIAFKNRLKQVVAIVVIAICAFIVSTFIQSNANSGTAAPEQELLGLPGSENTTSDQRGNEAQANTSNVSTNSSARTLLNSQKLTSEEALSGDMIGASIALSDNGQFMLVGASGDDAAGSDSGAVYAYKYDAGQWVMGQKIISPAAGQPLTYFGSAIALNEEGKLALIGASGESGEIGAAYILVKADGNWNVAARLAAPDGIAGDYFGSQVAISADGLTAAISAPNAGERQGVTYVFVNNGGAWVLQARLVASDGGAEDGFGGALSLSDDGSRLLVGAASDKREVGGAYLFDRAGGAWTEVQKLTASDPVEGDRFGYPVALSGDGTLALIGAIGNSAYLGAAYSFGFDGAAWVEQQKLAAPDAAGMTSFGSSLAMSDDASTAIIGAYGSEGTAGGTYVFKRKTNREGLVVWKDWGKLLAQDRSELDFFGTTGALDASGSRAVIGANGDGDFRGAVYAFFEDSFPQPAEMENEAMELPTEEAVFSTSLDLTPVPTVPAVVDPSELIANGEFESEGTSRDVAAIWSPLDGANQVSRKCKDATDTSFAGCVMQLNSKEGKVVIVGQSVDLTNKPLGAGDTLLLSGKIEAKGTAIDARVRVEITYIEAGLEKDTLSYKVDTETGGYIPLEGNTQVLRGTPQSIVVTLINQGLDGKVRFDGISLKWFDSGEAGFSSLQPLPPAQP